MVVRVAARVVVELVVVVRVFDARGHQDMRRSPHFPYVCVLAPGAPGPAAPGRDRGVSLCAVYGGESHPTTAALGRIRLDLSRTGRAV